MGKWDINIRILSCLKEGRSLLWLSYTYGEVGIQNILILSCLKEGHSLLWLSYTYGEVGYKHPHSELPERGTLSSLAELYLWGSGI